MSISMARSTVAQRTQLGKQTVYQTAVAANKRLPTLKIMPSPMNETHEYRAQGNKFTSVTVPNKEWAEATVDGTLTYGEAPYLFASLFGDAASATHGTAGHDWTFAPSDGSADTPAVYTLEHGDNGSNCIKTAGHVLTDLTLDFDRGELKLSGKTFGLAFTTGITMTASPTIVEDVPIQPGQVAVYLDSVFGSIGTTKLTQVLSAQFQLTGRWGPEWVLDPAQASYLQLVELEPKASATLLLAADATAMGLFSTYRAGSLVYVRIAAVGPQIEAGPPAVNYGFQLDLPLEIRKLQPYKDEGGVYAIGFEFAPISDPTAGFPMRCLVTNQVATL